MRKLFAAAAILALAGWSSAQAQPPHGRHQHHQPAPDCAVCVYGPHKVVTKTTLYGTKQEPFCLKPLSLLRCFSHRGPCEGECLPPRTKTRLVKWEESEECVKMKCVVEKPTSPLLLPPTAVAPR